MQCFLTDSNKMLLTTKTTVDSPMTEGDEKLSPSHCLLSLLLPLSPARVDWGPRSSRHSTRRPPPLGLRYFLQGQHQPDPEPVKLSVKPIVGDNKSPLPRLIFHIWPSLPFRLREYRILWNSSYQTWAMIVIFSS